MDVEQELTFVEGGSWVEARLAETTALELAAVGVVDSIPLGDGRWRLTPKTKVGTIRVAATTVRVRPKVPINQIIFMLGYAHNPGWNRSVAEFDVHDDFVTAIASVFAIQALEALRPGALQGYRSTDDSLPVLRGRLREQEQLRTRYGIPVPLLVRFDEFTTDIAENQILRAATEHLLRIRGLSASTLHALQTIRRGLSDVSPLVPGMAIPHWQPSRLNHRYQTALGLGEIVLDNSSFAHTSDSDRTVSATGFLVEMSTVFEAFVTKALGEELQSRSGRFSRSYRSWIDAAGAVSMRADLVWLHHREPVAVVDAKYKAEKLSGYPNADVYQMLAYCTALGLRVGHLVYARGNEIGMEHRIRNAGITVKAHVVDLTLPPVLLLEDIQRIASEVEASTPALSSLSSFTSRL